MAVGITGAGGKLGTQLQRAFPGSVSLKHEDLDVRELQEVTSWVRKSKPDTIVHAAAFTGIRQCEEDKALAWETNVTGTENLLRSCVEHSPSTFFVYISTACVFYGDRGDYSESDIPHPKNYYSLTKLLAEVAVRNSGLPHWLIIRTNFVPREKWPYPAAFTDRFGTYLFADDLAIAIKKVIERKMRGVLHVCGNQRMSMFDLARLTTPDVKPMTLRDYRGPPLTVDMSLSSRRIGAFELSMKPLEHLEMA